MDKLQINDKNISALQSQFADVMIWDAFTVDNISFKNEIVDTVYHYADLSTFKKIVEGQTLWATDIRFLNDQSEFKYGVELIVSIINEIKTVENRDFFDEILKELDRIFKNERFVCCFSKHGDILGQWKRYANNGKGLSIGFDQRKLASSLNVLVSGRYILYDLSQQKAVIDHLLRSGYNFFIERKEIFDWKNLGFEHVAALILIEFLETYISNYKDVFYLEEAEFRLEYCAFGPLQDKTSKIKKYRSGISTPIPYIELKPEDYNRRHIKDDMPEHSLWVKKLPIKEIIIGPSLEFEKIETEIRHFLKENGYDNISIKKSIFDLVAK